MWTAIFCLLLAGAGIGKAIADATAHGSPRLLRWFPNGAGPSAWRGKYRNNDPARGPRFWLSTTALVFLSDTWHAANFVTWLCWAGACLVACRMGRPFFWWAVGGLAASKFLFEPVYSWLRKAD